MAHLIRSEQRMAINEQTRDAFYAGRKMVASLPAYTRNLMMNAISGRIRAGVAADFDGTLVPTNEINRRFFTLGRYEKNLQALPEFSRSPLLLQTPVLNRNAMSGLAMMDIPTGVISGNTSEYVSARCTDPVRDFIMDSIVFRTRVINFATYALNGGLLTIFDGSGAENLPEMDVYNATKKIPSELATELYGIMDSELGRTVSIPLDEPIMIRSGRTESITRWPLIQLRTGVQICVIGVSGETRDRMIDSIRKALSSKAAGLLNIQPGGQYTIDGAMRSLLKTGAGQDFSTRYALDHLFYLGDAVYQKGDKEGNDFSMVHNPNTTVLAVNDRKQDVPDHQHVSWIGKGPTASYKWLTWFLIERANNIIEQDPHRKEEMWGLFKILGFCGN